MSQTPTEIVQALLKDPTNLNMVSQLVAPNATYVSLNFENAELKSDHALGWYSERASGGRRYLHPCRSILGIERLSDRRYCGV